MKRRFAFGVAAFLCLCLLAGCGAPAAEKAEPEKKENSEPQVQEVELVQEMSTEELQGYFEKAYEAKGNCLETPEQLESELAELKAITTDVTLPEDYEAQYQEWRSGHIETYLAELQEGYRQIMDELPQYVGIDGGAVYADIVDLEGNGKPNLLVVNVFTEDDFAVYGDIDGHVQQYPVDIGDVETIQGDSSYVSLVTCDGKTYIKTQDINGHDLTNIFYKVQNGQVQVEAAFYDGSELAPGSEEKELLYSDIWSRLVRVSSRGILPELSPEAKQKASFLQVLNDDIKYAKLIDFDRDGDEDLLIIREEETERVFDIFKVYLWDGEKTEPVNLYRYWDDEYFSDIGAADIEGICREKSTGDLYVSYYDEEEGTGLQSGAFENVSKYIIYDDIKYSENIPSREEIEPRFEWIEKIDWYGLYTDAYETTVDSVRQQLMER